MKYLIVGLGNPGPEYSDTRHNIGFRVVDALAGPKAQFTSGRYADHAVARHKGRAFVLIKPATFMNLSGNAVRYWMEKENIPAERTLVITDDLALPFGKLRLREKGSGGGHNGLEHIIATLGTTEFPRLRFGIGDAFPRGGQVDHVLSTWTAEERKTLDERIGLAVEAAKEFGLMGIAHAMNNFNKR